ncbi:MAG TPA: sugar transferase [Terracidiphilus sp.]
MFKRAFDISLAGFLLVAVLPILAVAAILIKLDSDGPVLFSQARMGRGFRRFKILKLRTMHAGSRRSMYTVSQDPRITRIGRWLRWLKVDELPQLWNVLRGEMSLVGSRPVVPELAAEFEPAYASLLKARPGLTDPATLKYCREDEFLALVADHLRYYKTILMPDKLRISQAYLQRATPWSDLRVLVSTVLVLFLPHWRSPLFPAWTSAPIWTSVPASTVEFRFPEPVQTAEAHLD